jgi:acyl-coenzyme A thioesterase PaaI-like protein
MGRHYADRLDSGRLGFRVVASDKTPISAARLAEQLGDELPSIQSVPASAFDLVASARDLVEAIVLTDVDGEARGRAADAIAAVTAALRTQQRAAPLFLVRHEDGRVESMLNAGSGRLNPQAAPVEWIERPAEPPRGSEPRLVTVRARCVFTAAHGGSPNRVYGGVLACVLDEVLGIAVNASGVSGMTVSLTTSLKGGTPFDVPVDIVARCTGYEGRKSYATGEVVIDGAVTAEASAIYVGERRDD